MPKRARTPQPSSSSSDEAAEDIARNTLDPTKFVNLSAQHYYWNVMVGRSFVPERGFKPSKKDGNLMEQIARRGWALFGGTPCSAPMVVVREFYANARETQNGISYVRGKEIQYSPEAIRSLYHLPVLNPEQADWVRTRRFSVDLDKLVQELCKPGTRWKTKSGTTQKTTFPHTALNRYTKAWYSFICANIIPTSHHADVTTERAILLYGILKMEPIDLSYLINQSMLRFMRAGTSGGIPHAAIITCLCNLAGVEWGEETLQLPMRNIDTATISKYQIWDGGESHPWGLGFIIPGDDDSEEEEDEEDEDDAPATEPQ